MVLNLTSFSLLADKVSVIPGQVSCVRDATDTQHVLDQLSLSVSIVSESHGLETTTTTITITTKQIA